MSAASANAVTRIVNKNSDIINIKTNSKKQKINSDSDSNLKNASLLFIVKKKRELDLVQDRKR